MKELIEKYGTIGTVEVGEQEFPIINIPMMSDENGMSWQGKMQSITLYVRTEGSR